MSNSRMRCTCSSAGAIAAVDADGGNVEAIIRRSVFARQVYLVNRAMLRSRVFTCNMWSICWMNGWPKTRRDSTPKRTGFTTAPVPVSWTLLLMEPLVAALHLPELIGAGVHTPKLQQPKALNRSGSHRLKH